MFEYDKKSLSVELPDMLGQEGNPSKRETVYIGIRGCDLESVRLLDGMMLSDNADIYYKEHRRDSLFFVFDCVEPADGECFCYLLYDKDHTIADGVFYTYEGDYLFSVQSKTARKIVKKFLDEYDDDLESVAYGDGWEKVFESLELPKPVQADDAYNLMDKKERLLDMEKVEAVCQKEAENCLSCGSCFMVCPTCYCFSLKDVDEVGMMEGKRIREWDGCMLEDFSLVAGGHRLVAGGVERSMHRFNRKYKNALTEYGRFICIGCGRCSRACPAGNSIKTMLIEL